MHFVKRYGILSYSMEGERSLVKQAVKKGARVLSGLGIAYASSFSPIDSPINASAEETQLSVHPKADMLLHGDGNRNRLNVLLLDWNGASLQMMQDVAVDMFFHPPTDQFKDWVNVYWKRTTRNLGCRQVDIEHTCNWDEINKETDDVGNIHAVMVVAKSNDAFTGNGASFVPRLPSNHAPSVIFRPAVLPDNVRPGFASDILHEFWGHQIGGFHHEGEDVMLRKTNTFNDQHTQFLRELSKLWPHNYYTPALRFLLGRSLQNIDQINQLPTMELNIPATDIPEGTKWVKLWIRQEDGPAITQIYGHLPLIDRMRLGEFKVDMPDVVNNKSTVLLHDQAVKVSIYGTNEDHPTKPGQAPDWDSSAWIEHKARPNLTVPSNKAEATWRTPKSTTVIGNLTEARMADSTPTLRWSSTDPTAWYFQVQMSGDIRFNPNPDTATSFVFDNFVHGGQTKDTWTVPETAALKPGIYYFRVRERIQGSGTPAQWSPAFPIEITPKMVQARMESQLSNIMDPACYRLLGLYQQMRDEALVNDIMTAPRVTLDKDSIQVKFNPKEALLPNRAQKRKQARLQKAA